MLVTKIYRRICNYIWQKKRKKINAEYREQMLGCDVPTIFCCNCTGGVMYHDDYYGAAEPPVRCGVSHLSGPTEPPDYYKLL